MFLSLFSNSNFNHLICFLYCLWKRLSWLKQIPHIYSWNKWKRGKHSKLFAYKSRYHCEIHLRSFKCLGKQMFNSQQLLFSHPLSPFCLSLASTCETEMNWKLFLTFKCKLLHMEYWDSLSTLAGFQRPFLCYLATNRTLEGAVVFWVWFCWDFFF